MSDAREFDRTGVRASDRERDRVAAELRRHWVEGRIGVEELDQRLEGVLAARTILELAELTYDLPSLELAEAPPARTRRRLRVGPPGLLPFTERIEVSSEAERTRAHALEKLAPALNAYGYELITQAPEKLVFERSGHPGWTLLVAVAAFPIGLIALAIRRTERIEIALEPSGGSGTLMVVHGKAPRRVRKAFAQLQSA